ncbi:hypothetical protein Phi4:1_gp156 [Cellulophaga phage phi4:1]|uniref:Uncharacterized protein n=5 Tax=Lightbulbvirus TaxID=1918522 RepID=A0A0S2MWT6_9CAUD|nr:hypothetical protein Phi4:1_gp156 [Cellulophaga phage phi4:1]YP_008241655.1 hypothetical protein Phi17:2_gp160 [Cellulophaga phage phi17:2]ALO80165.1 hypothetical protein Phi4113_156 [Cellulophaga phage phi4:1_13]ALO80362.1 hypothetical protein Phi4118_156 [Cellulophaga phage phi4:1_18]ALO80563.1 hypothetical protein Phi17218_160 [Cellulophaga phage phi17:2_18]AGO47693.1 hypothetical protein Phi17:2_gp160 [Cellulophaga phage phi17:2]AGO49569.1 hypothetical protein Phi4:1_gp156 [Cellulophag
MFYLGAIVAATRKKRQGKRKNKRKKDSHPIHNTSKEEYYHRISKGKCGSCGEDSGEYLGICDECRYS